MKKASGEIGQSEHNIQLGNGWYKSQFHDKGLQPFLPAIYDALP
jgi:hypothetical protein